MQRYFTNLLQRYEKIRGHSVDKELDSAFWDVIVLTAADEAQKNVYEKQLKYKYQRQELPANIEILVVADPPGPKIGNGGSTIVALEILREKFGMNLYDYRVMIIHAGGQSQRMPSASVLGKIFSPIPRGNPIYQMLDIKLAMFYPLIQKMPAGVFVTCADDFLVYDLGDSHGDVKFSEKGFTVLAHPSSLTVGTGHGVYVIDDIKSVNPLCPLQVCECLEVLQKPSEVLMYKKGAVLHGENLEFPDEIKVDDKVAYTDSSFFFAHDISKKLLTFAAENGPLSCEIDAYGDFLQALGPKATSAYIYNTSNVSIVTPSLLATREKMFNLLNKSKITVLVMNCSKFIHIGTTKEYIEHFCCDDIFQAEMGLEKDVFNVWTRTSQVPPMLKSGLGDASDQHLPPKRLRLSDTSQGCVMHSYLHAESTISATSVIEFCSFSIPIKVGQCCILSNCEFKADIRVKDAEGKTPSLIEYMNTVECLDFPNDLFVHTIPITYGGQSTKFVTVFFDIKDNLKKEAPEKDIKRLPFLGKLVEDFTAVTDGIIAKVTPEDTDAKLNLWNTNLFPVTDDASDSLILALKCIDAVKTDKPGKISLASFRQVSMATVLKERDLDVMLERRNVLYNTIKLERNMS